jgi:predicted Fe-S protein YdhL (DUF1289 family)
MTLAMQALRQRAAEVRALAEGEPVPSPCVSICRMDADRTWCEGCRRSIAEITAWRATPEDGKRAIWRLIEQRLEKDPA